MQSGLTCKLKQEADKHDHTRQHMAKKIQQRTITRLDAKPDWAFFARLHPIWDKPSCQIANSNLGQSGNLDQVGTNLARVLWLGQL